MTKMQTIAKRLNTLFKIANIFFGIAVVTLAVALIALAGASLVGLPHDIAATAMERLSFGSLDLTIAPEYAPNAQAVVRYLLTCLPTTLAGILLNWLFLLALQRLLESAAEGLPFAESAWKELRTMAWLTIGKGISLNITTILDNWASRRFLQVETLLQSDKITAVVLDQSLDLSFLLYVFVLLLLSYVFRYGTELQVQVDETV